MSDTINHPKHYTSSLAKCQCGQPIECIQVAEHLGFNVGNVVKYLWRADHKGATLEDLKKAAWYLQREIENRERLQRVNSSALQNSEWSCVEKHQFPQINKKVLLLRSLTPNVEACLDVQTRGFWRLANGNAASFEQYKYWRYAE